MEHERKLCDLTDGNSKDGLTLNAKMSETELVTAQVEFFSEDVPGKTEKDINEKLRKINAELERYTNHADKADYAIAVASGIMTGVLDSFLFSDTSIFDNALGDSHRQVNMFIQKFADDRGLTNKDIKTKLGTVIGKLEKAFPVAQDNVWKGRIDKVYAKNHHLADLAHHPTPLGLLAAIAVKFLRVGVFVNRDGEWTVQLVKIQDYEKKDMALIIAAAVVTGIMNWLVNIAENKYEEVEGKELPKSIKTLAHIVASAPMLIEVFKCADNWFGHLVSDMGGSSSSADKTGGMGIPGVFLSLCYELASLPILKDTGLPEVLNDLYQNKRFDIRHELALGQQVKRQAIPVAFNELFVRTAYMIGALADEACRHNGFRGINWRRVLPFANRTVDRMLTVSLMTFTVADTADAAVRAAVESGGNFVIFSGRFVARYNFVGAGRAAVAIVREISDEKKEAQLIHERMLLMNDKAREMYIQLQDFKTKLNEKLNAYFAEDIEAFMLGFNDIGKGIRTNDSDLVIHGNVTIQRVLGREVQFTNQQEFDDLMDSDDPFEF